MLKPSDATTPIYLTLIAAATSTNGIGRGSQLPWRLPKEMAYFTRVTTAVPIPSQTSSGGHESSTGSGMMMNAVVMGRKSWECIPDKYRPLNGRMNVVVSRNESYSIPRESCKDTPTVLFTTSLANAITSLHSLRTPPQINKTFIIGGAEIYNAALALRPSLHGSYVNRILLTRILEPEYADCDTFFPDFLSMGEKEWRRTSHEELEEWVGLEVPRGVVSEKEAKYEFQMWLRDDES